MEEKGEMAWGQHVLVGWGMGAHLQHPAVYATVSQSLCPEGWVWILYALPESYTNVFLVMLSLPLCYSVKYPLHACDAPGSDLISLWQYVWYIW